MVFFTRGFGGRDQIAIVQLRDQTISLALLGVTIINANSWRPRLNSKGSGSCTFNCGCPLHIAGLDVASMFIWNRAPFFKAASICLGGNRSFSTSDNFLLELWKAGFKWEDLVSRVSIHYVRNHCTSLWCLLCISSELSWMKKGTNLNAEILKWNSLVVICKNVQHLLFFFKKKGKEKKSERIRWYFYEESSNCSSQSECLSFYNMTIIFFFWKWTSNLPHMLKYFPCTGKQIHFH